MIVTIQSEVEIICAFFLNYVKLYLGFYDLNWGGVRRGGRQNGGGDQCGSGFCGRRRFAVYYDDRCDGIVGRADGDRAEVGADREADAWDTAFYQIPVPADSGGTSGQGVYCYESDC